MRLSERDRAVLAAVETNAEASAEEVARSAGTTERSARYSIDKLISSGILKRKIPLINTYLLGALDHSFYFSLKPGSEKDLNEFLSRLQKRDSVCWISRVGGEFQHAVLFSEENIVHAWRAMQEELECSGVSLLNKAVSTRSLFSVFPRSYLSSASKKRKGIVLSVASKSHALDEADHQILSAMANESFSSRRALAKQLGMAHATVDRRVRALEKTGIIAGYMWSVDYRDLGVERYKLLVAVQTPTLKFTEKLLSFCRKEPHITNFAECVGDWEYEISYEAFDRAAAANVRDRIVVACGDSLREVHTIPALGHEKFSLYPFR